MPPHNMSNLVSKHSGEFRFGFRRSDEIKVNVNETTGYSIRVYPFHVNHFKRVRDTLPLTVLHEGLSEVVDVVCHDRILIKFHLLFMLCNELLPELQLLCVGEDVDIAELLNDCVAHVPDSSKVNTPHTKA